ncbi:MAG: hypothetical protein NC489_21320 [Ruminococcus flavefaciens]|nr:hypothetical protein [Ruminococcus flavefaciens]
MTERTLEKANAIKKELDNARGIYKGLEELQALCWGNTGEVAARKFYVEVREGDVFKKRERVTPEAAKVALDKVMKEILEEIEGLKGKLEELH